MVPLWLPLSGELSPEAAEGCFSAPKPPCHPERSEGSRMATLGVPATGSFVTSFLRMTACFSIFPTPHRGGPSYGVLDERRESRNRITGKENGGGKPPPRRTDKVRRTLSVRFKLHFFVMQSTSKNPACQKSPRRTFCKLKNRTEAPSCFFEYQCLPLLSPTPK